MKGNFSVLFQLKHYMLWSKEAREGTHFWEFWVFASKFVKFLMSISKRLVNSSSNFVSFFSFMRHNSSVHFWLNFYILSTKGVHQSANLVKFHVSGRKSEILHFDGLLLSKSYKFSARKVQNLSWHWRLMQSLKKNWLVISNMT